MTVYVGLGSNLGNRWGALRVGLRGLAVLPRTRLEAVSDPFETDPVGGPPGQPPFLNAAARLRTGLDPFDLLRGLQALERQAGRVRGAPDGPRTLDLDLLFYGRRRLKTPRLTLPHPRALERRFVLAPLAAILAGGRLPGTRERAVRLLDRLPERPAARPRLWPSGLAEPALLR